MRLIIISLAGYIAALMGFIPGAVFSVLFSKLNRKFYGGLMGFTAGLLIAFVCFEILPPAFENHGLIVGTLGIISGVALSAWAGGAISKANIPSNAYSVNDVRMGIVLGLSVMLHKLPEGMAVGSMLAYDPKAGLPFALVIAVHCFPEAVAVVLPLKRGGFSLGKILVVCFIVCAPMGIGSILGAVMSNISGVFVSVCLALSGGVMIYITCGEILPESQDVWRGRLSTVCACAGFLAGIILTTKL